MNESQAREEICRVGRSLWERGYVHATSGNISARLDDGFLITPTDSCMGFLDPARLSKLDGKMKHISGDRASKTIALHTHIYETTRNFDASIRCVIHTHSTYCVALSLKKWGGELLPALTPYFVMKVGRVPLVPYHRPGDPKVAELVGHVIEQYGQRGTPIRAVMLERLGPNVWHDTPAAAMAVLEELEETAKLWLLSEQAPVGLDDHQIQELRQNFSARW